MRALVLQDFQSKRKPSLSSGDFVKEYKKGDILEVSDALFGQDAGDDSQWYKLENGSFVNEEFLRIHITCSALPEPDQRQYLIAFHQTENGKIRDDLKSAPDTLSFSEIKLPPTTDDTISVAYWDPNKFASTVAKSLDDLKESQKHVFIYIPGFQLQVREKIRTDLLADFTLSYLAHPNNSIAKVLLLSWPAQGGPKRETVDDRGYALGRDFAEKGMLDYFVQLSNVLKQKGKFLNLVVHSLGHQFLNGMLNSAQAVALPPDTFKNVFLMAPDISYGSVSKNGIKVKNVYGQPDYITCNLSVLSKIAKGVNVFYDQYDYVLYFSTVKFSGGLSKNIDKMYFNLGNYGAYDIPGNEIESNFQFFDVNELVNHKENGSWDFRFTTLKGTELGDAIERVQFRRDYTGINWLEILEHKNALTNHHTYLFTCKEVVDKVLDILKQTTTPILEQAIAP
jgi:hypothetical protein